MDVDDPDAREQAHSLAMSDAAAARAAADRVITQARALCTESVELRTWAAAERLKSETRRANGSGGRAGPDVS